MQMCANRITAPLALWDGWAAATGYAKHLWHADCVRAHGDLFGRMCVHVQTYAFDWYMEARLAILLLGYCVVQSEHNKF